jgi:threonine synthase
MPVPDSPVPDSPVSEAHAGRESGGDAGPLSNDTFRPASTRGQGRGLAALPRACRHLRPWKTSLADGRIEPTDRCVLYSCATGLKYPLPKIEKRLDRDGEIDWRRFA